MRTTFVFLVTSSDLLVPWSQWLPGKQVYFCYCRVAFATEDSRRNLLLRTTLFYLTSPQLHGTQMYSKNHHKLMLLQSQNIFIEVMIQRIIVIISQEAQNVKWKAVGYWEEYWNERMLFGWRHHFRFSFNTLGNF